eukprot:1711076-Alexandrium_andersonii.AAC.1
MLPLARARLHAQIQRDVQLGPGRAATPRLRPNCSKRRPYLKTLGGLGVPAKQLRDYFGELRSS